jgi:hypothetical protein
LLKAKTAAIYCAAVFFRLNTENRRLFARNKKADRQRADRLFKDSDSY